MMILTYRSLYILCILHQVLFEVVNLLTYEYEDMSFPGSLALGVQGSNLGSFHLGNPESMFLDSVTTREAWFKFNFEKGTLLECCVKDDAGAPQGTVIIQVVVKERTGPGGHDLRANFVCASDQHYRWWMESGEGVKNGRYHLCDGEAKDCTTKPRRGIMVHDKFRHLTKELLAAKDPSWAFSRVNKPALQLALPGVSDRGGVPSSPQLPWEDPDKKDNQSSDDESEKSEEEEEEEEALDKKLASLRKQLQTAAEEGHEEGQEGEGKWL